MVRTLAAHDVFWASIDEPRFAQPLEYALRLCRTSRHLHPWLVGDFLQRSGAGLFDRSTPDGYPEEDVAYADSNAMVQRWRLAQDCLHALAGMCPATWRYTDQATDEAWAQRVVDSIAVRLTGHQLGERSNTVAVDMLTRAEGTTDQRVQNLSLIHI